MKVFLTLLFSIVGVVAFAGETPVAPEPASVVATDCDSCSTNNCKVRRGLFGRRRFIRSTEYTCDKSGSTYSRTRCVTDGCDNVLRSRTYSKTICSGNTCDCK